MKSSVKKILFWLFFVCTLIGMLLWRTPFNIQTNLNSLIRMDGYSEWPINEITGKFSNVVNIVIKSENIDAVMDAANKITNDLTWPDFQNLSIINSDVSISNIAEKLQKYRNSFIGINDRKLLQTNDFNTITENAVTKISGTMSPTILSLQNDPFLLTTNYISELTSANGKWELRNGFLWQYNYPHNYILISSDINCDNSDCLIGTVGAVQKMLQRYNNPDIQIFMSGVPVHTAQMTKNSKIQLTIFSIIAFLSAILLNWLLFRKLSTIVPGILVLSLGFVGGATALFAYFANPHILTFVFGVTLIGLGIDYIFHFISSTTDKTPVAIRKNIFLSFLTTLVCFLPLMFSSLSLLQQISVFTIFGLTTIYIMLLIFMPKHPIDKIADIKIPQPITGRPRWIIMGVICVVICATLPFVRAQNNMSVLYRPSAELMQAEALMQNLSGLQKSNFLIIRGKTLDDALMQSEHIKDEYGNYFDLATIIPSHERQTENKLLIQKLYKSQSYRIKNELGLRKTPRFIDTQLIQIDDVKSDKIFGGLFKKFLFNDGTYFYIVANVPNDFSISTQNAISISPTQQITNLMKQYSDETYRLLGICGISLMLLLFVLYRARAFIYLAPTLLAVGMTVSVLTWFGVAITFFHLLALFIVIGLCLDYSIFHINAHNNNAIKPVLFSCLTSLISFGILGFASFFLIKSMGITLGLGISFGYLCSLFLFRRAN